MQISNGVQDERPSKYSEPTHELCKLIFCKIANLHYRKTFQTDFLQNSDNKHC